MREGLARELTTSEPRRAGTGRDCFGITIVRSLAGAADCCDELPTNLTNPLPGMTRTAMMRYHGAIPYPT